MAATLHQQIMRISKAVNRSFAFGVKQELLELKTLLYSAKVGVQFYPSLSISLTSQLLTKALPHTKSPQSPHPNPTATIPSTITDRKPPPQH